VRSRRSASASRTTRSSSPSTKSHAASAFFPSPFDAAAIVTLDGVGEWPTTTIGVGEGNRIALLREQNFPHSLGLLYSAFTADTGFRPNFDEYEVKGLAPYGRPVYRSSERWTPCRPRARRWPTCAPRSTSSMSERAPAPLRKKLVLALGASVVTFLVLEGAARVWIARLASPEQFSKFASLAQYRERAGGDEWWFGLIVPRRYLGYALAPNLVDGPNRHNSLGFRGEEFPREKPPGETRIACLGASTTYTIPCPTGGGPTRT